MAITEIFEFEFPQDEVNRAIQEMARLRGEIASYREQNKELKKEGKENSLQYTQNALAIKQLSGELRTNERVVSANTKAQEANKGSIQQLRSQLSVVTDQWSKLSEEERENTVEGQKLVKQKLQLTNQLKNLEKQTGDTRRNVGNYSEGMREALKETGLFTREQQALASVQRVVTTVTKGSTSATKLFKIALASTGIGLIVVALGSLVSYLTSTQKGMDKVTAVTRPLVAIFEKMKGVIQELGGSVFKGLAMILKGDIKEGLEVLGSGFTDAFQNAKAAVKEGAEIGKQLDQLQKRIERFEVDRDRRVAALNRKFEEQKSIAEDTTKAESERIAAAREAMKAQEDIAAIEKELIDLRIEKLKLSQSLNDTDREGEKEMQDLLAQREQIEATAISRQKEARNQLNSINKQALDNEKKIQAEREKMDKEQAEKYIENLERSITEGTERRLTALKQQLLDETITREEYNQQIFNLELSALEAQLQLQREMGESTVNIEKQIVDLRLAEKERLANYEAAIAQKSADDQQKADDIKKNSAQSTASAIAGFLSQTGAQNKQAASVAAVINTAQGVTASLKAGGIFGVIQAAIIAAKGAIEISKINSTKVPKFATGVIGLDGPGSETSDSIPARLSRGESVVTARATKQYAPVLAEMERSVGNTPNFQLGNRRFATGVINAGVNAANINARTSAARELSFSRQLENLKIYTKITDIDRVRTRNNQAESIAEITD